MIPTYINNWFRVIENMRNENTYKLAFGRALVECIYMDKISSIDEDNFSVSLKDIARKMLKYYWNQIFFFDLKQSPKRKDERVPFIVQYTNDLIAKYKEVSKSALPSWFDKVCEVLDEKEIEATVNKIALILPKDVSWRFKKIEEEVDLFRYDYINKDDHLVLTSLEISLIKDYALVLSKLLNYKWAQLLEKFNYAPKIASKVSNISETKLKRNSLTKYKEQLMKEFKDGVAIDFYSGEKLDNNDISVDHVIPWSFMYSDDIWNLVLTSKSNNSSKSNSIPSLETINKLKERNEKLINILDESYAIEMEIAMKSNYIDKYYFDCRM